MEALYDKIGKGYNDTRKADPYILGRLAALLMPEQNGCYLDLGCGTGNYTRALADTGLTLYGIDPSEEMLGVARSYTSAAKWKPGAAENIPMADNSVDGIVCTLTIHHWQDIYKSFSELHRVLRDNGRIVIFTALPAQMEAYWLKHYFPQMLETSAAKMPDMEIISNAAISAGLNMVLTEKYFVHDNLQDMFLYVGKSDPELYFDENIRKGISSFADLANAEEVSSGLAALRSDIESGKHESVKNSYDAGKGDYLFIVLQKTAIA